MHKLTETVRIPKTLLHQIKNDIDFAKKDLLSYILIITKNCKGNLFSLWLTASIF